MSVGVMVQSTIRARGKRGNRDARTKEIVSTRKHAKLDYIKGKQEEYEQLSAFERLPSELLEPIFILSGNLAMLSVSKRFRNLLNTKKLINELIVEQFYQIGFFRSVGDTVHVIKDSAAVDLQAWKRNITHPQFEFSAFLDRMKEWQLERVMFRLKVFFKAHAVSQYNLNDHFKALKRVLDDTVRVKDPDQAQVFVRSQHEFRTYSRRAEYKEKYTYLVKSETCSVRFQFHDLQGYACSIGRIDSLYEHAKASGELHCDCGYKGDPAYGAIEQSFHVTFDSDCYTLLSFNLFRAPFTQSKGDIFKFLLDNVFLEHDYSDEGPEPYKRFMDNVSCGLLEAIELGCIPAMYCLGGLGMGQREDEPRTRLPFVATNLWSSDPPLVRGLTTNTENSDPWQHLVGSAWSPHYKSFTPLTPKVNEAHILTCLKRFDNWPELYLLVFERLVHTYRRQRNENLPNEVLNKLYLLHQDYDGYIRSCLKRLYNLHST